MPIYEFYCEDCNTIFNFFSKSVNTRKKPKCPKCKTKTLTRQMSAFAFTGKAKEDSEMDDLPFDESKMEKAMQMLAGEAENMNEDDPKQAADLMAREIAAVNKISDTEAVRLIETNLNKGPKRGAKAENDEGDAQEEAA